MEKNIPTVFLTFLSYKRTIQNCSQLTVNEYYSDIRTFFRYIIKTRNNLNADLKDIDTSAVDVAYAQSITNDEVYAFLLYMANEQKNNSRTRARKLSSLKAFYKYHTSKAYTFANDPTKNIDAPAVKASLPKYLSLDESLALLDSIDSSDSHRERDYAILTLFLNCGMRLAELVGISLSDIESDFTKLVVTGKGNKMRVIYLNDACRSAIKNYLNVRQRDFVDGKKIIKDKNALFLSRLGKRISQKTVQYIVKKQLELSGLAGRGYSTHKLRHTAATLMYNYGNVDIRVLKDVLGHEQLTTTQIYTHVSDDKIAAAMDLNPLANVRKK